MRETPAPADRQRAAHPRGNPVTPEQVEAFLRGVAEHGSRSASARAALPDRVTAARALRCFNQLAARDPAFALAVDEAVESYRDTLRREIHRRAVEGVRSPLYRAGAAVYDMQMNQVYETTFSDSLLALAAKAHLPEFVDRKIIDGRIDHVHHGAPGTLTLSLEDVSGLSAEQRQQLGAILKAIKRNRNPGAPMAATHATPALESPATDAEFSEPVDNEMAELARINC